MKTPLALLAGAGVLAALAATPAAAESRISFGVSVNSGYGGYNAPYRYGSRYDRFDRYSRYDRFYRGGCSYYDAFCDYPVSYRRSRRIAPPAYVLAPPPRTTVWEQTERYDPMPRWQALAGRPDSRAPAYSAPAPSPRLQQAAAPAARGDLVRYDLAEQGYSAADVQAAPDYGAYGATAGYDGYGGYDGRYQNDAPVRYDRYGGAAAGQPSGAPEDLLLGGPR